MVTWPFPSGAISHPPRTPGTNNTSHIYTTRTLCRVNKYISIWHFKRRWRLGPGISVYICGEGVFDWEHVNKKFVDNPTDAEIYPQYPNTRVRRSPTYEIDAHKTIMSSMVDSECVKLLKTEYNPSNDVGPEGVTSLILAAERGRLPVVRWLVKQMRQLNQNRMDMFSKGNDLPIELNLQIKDYLNPMDINQADNIGRTPLYAAALNKWPWIVRFLKDNGADVNKATLSGTTPLMNAAWNRDVKMVRVLIKCGADVDQAGGENNATPLYVAIHSYPRPAQWSAHRISVVEELLTHGADPNLKTGDGKTPLILAIRRGLESIVQCLVEHGADVNQAGGEHNNMTPLYVTIQIDSKNEFIDYKFRVLEELLKHGADPNMESGDGETPLDAAIRNGLFPIVQSLLQYGADANKAGRRKRTNPLKTAVWYDGRWFPSLGRNHWGRGAIVQTLVDNDADVNLNDDTGTNALYYVAGEGHLDFLQMFISRGRGLVNSTSNYGRTPLHIAAENGHVDVVRWLVENTDADINHHANKFNITPLYLAAKGGHVDVVKCLLDEGADFTIESVNKTPLTVAREFGHQEVEDLLREKRQVADLLTAAERELLFSATPLTPSQIEEAQKYPKTRHLIVGDYGPEFSNGDGRVMNTLDAHFD